MIGRLTPLSGGFTTAILAASVYSLGRVMSFRRASIPVIGYAGSQLLPALSLESQSALPFYGWEATYYGMLGTLLPLSPHGTTPIMLWVACLLGSGGNALVLLTGLAATLRCPRAAWILSWTGACCAIGAIFALTRAGQRFTPNAGCVLWVVSMCGLAWASDQPNKIDSASSTAKRPP